MRNSRNIQICPASVAVVAGLILAAGSFERDMSLMVVGCVVLIVGAMVLCTRHVADTLRAVNRPADEAWTEGYESGYDKGWRDGNNDARPKMTVLRGELAAEG